jgi:hypothetical protein
LNGVQHSLSLKFAAANHYKTKNWLYESLARFFRYLMLSNQQRQAGLVVKNHQIENLSTSAQKFAR